MNKDSRNLAFYLGHDDGGVARLQGGDVFRRVFHRNQLSGFHFYRYAGRALGLRPLDRAPAAG
jgi:hypothetical protein